MKNRLSHKVRGLIVLGFTLVMAGIIAYEHFYEGGVTTHQLLHDPNLPGFSNWLGLGILPVFVWLVTAGIQPRDQQGLSRRRPIVSGFSLLVGFGIAMSIAFLTESPFTLYGTLGLLVFALFTPLYRAENLLGYVLGMLFTFGAIIPILFGSLFWGLFYLIYLGKKGIIQAMEKKAYNSET